MTWRRLVTPPVCCQNAADGLRTDRRAPGHAVRGGPSDARDPALRCAAWFPQMVAR